MLFLLPAVCVYVTHMLCVSTREVLYMSLVKLYSVRHISLANACKTEREGKGMFEDVFVWQDVSKTHMYFSG